MSEYPSGLTACGSCAFWRHRGGPIGNCHRYPPVAGPNVSEVARWPETEAADGCGDGVPTGVAAPRQIRCGECLYWHEMAPGQGLNPINRRDQFAAWWREAGHCRRHAPPTGTEPGYHGFWRATHATDGCGEGKAV